MTEFANSFTTQMSLPLDVMPAGSSNPYFEAPMILTRAPVEGESSVTVLSDAFATQRCGPSDVMASGLSNP